MSPTSPALRDAACRCSVGLHARAPAAGRVPVARSSLGTAVSEDTAVWGGYTDAEIGIRSRGYLFTRTTCCGHLPRLVGRVQD